MYFLGLSFFTFYFFFPFYFPCDLPETGISCHATSCHVRLEVIYFFPIHLDMDIYIYTYIPTIKIFFGLCLSFETAVLSFFFVSCV